MSNSDDKKMPLPTFSGMGMPMNVAFDVEDDIGEEVTRRIGGTPSFNPSFAPVTFDQQVFSTGPSISTAPFKAATAPSIDVVGPSAWKLTDATVLPEFHPLERTAVFVPNTSPNQVAYRVSAILRERSIQADFQDSKAKCVTADNVDFRVFLYRGQKQYSHGIIVEVQRRFGNSINFYADTQAILDAAEGKTVAPPDKKAKTLPLVEEEQDGDVVSSSSLDFVAKMLTHTGQDAQYLALQTLSSLTDREKMGKTTAGDVAKVLLTPGNEVGVTVLEIVMKRSGVQDEHGIRLMAMTVLCNVLTALNGNVSANLQALLRPVMMEELQNAEGNPQMAFISAKCLEPLLNYSMDDGELYSALRGALQVGKDKHAGLAEIAEKCLQTMEH